MWLLLLFFDLDLALDLHLCLLYVLLLPLLHLLLRCFSTVAFVSCLVRSMCVCVLRSSHLT